MKPQISLLLSLSIVFSLPIYSQNSIDFGKKSNWISFPDEIREHQVDVFYVYPTILFSKTPENMNTSDEELRKLARGVFTEQSGVFKNECNVYAPYYAQMSIAVLSLTGPEYNQHFNLAYEQVKSAFLYYIKNENQGKPFFLAGHSQGSLMLLNLMKEMFDDKELKKQLIAAYIIGYSITADDLKNYPWLNIAQSDDDTGVIITYNTQSPDATGSPVLLPTAACVNPLNWTTQKTYASADLNLGAVFFNEAEQIDQEIPHYTDAQIGENNALLVTGPDPNNFYTEGVSFFPIGVFHKYDYQFFYRNLEQNIQIRKVSFLNSLE